MISWFVFEACLEQLWLWYVSSWCCDKMGEEPAQKFPARTTDHPPPTMNFMETETLSAILYSTGFVNWQTNINICLLCLNPEIYLYTCS